MALKTDDNPNRIQNDYDDRFNQAGSTASSLYDQEQGRYDREFDSIANNYDKIADPTQENEATKRASDIQGREASGSWHNGVTSAAASLPTGPAGSFAKTAVSKFTGKKSGPLAGIIGIIIAITAALNFFGAPALLLVNFAEKITERMNVQEASYSVRTNKILKTKIESTTKGSCGIVKALCKYQSMSKYQVEKFKKAGIDIKGNDSLVPGRFKPTSFIFKGKEISPEEFSKMLKTNVEFNDAVRRAYTTKLAAMSDHIFYKVASRLKLSKAAPFKEGMTDKERADALKKAAREGTLGGVPRKVTEGDKVDPNCTENCKTYTADEATAANNAAGYTEGISGDAEQVAKDGARKASGSVMSKIGKGLVSGVKITGLVDNACTFFGMWNAVAVGAKAIVSIQLARYAMQFLSSASQIKAGEARPEDISFLATVLTTTYLLDDGSTTNAATDGVGYRYVAYGDPGMSEVGTAFMVGGGLGGKLSGAMDAVLGILGGKDKARETCNINNNPFVQIGSFLVGLALWIIPGGQAISGSKLAAQVGFAAITMAAMVVLPGLLADIVAGVVVDDTTVGEAAGDALTSGSGSMLSKVANAGGNLPLTPEAALVYNQDLRRVLAENAAYDRRALSPFDAMSPNTFMGSIYTSLVPYANRMQSTSTALASLGNLVSPNAILGNIMMPAKAATIDYTECKDLDYGDLGMAADKFCNPIFGIPSKFLQDDPDTITQRLLDSNDIDPDSGDPSSDRYKDFIKECFDRDQPYGASTDDSGTKERGKRCVLGPNGFIDEDIKDEEQQLYIDFAVHYIDERINKTMDEGLPEPFNDGGTQSSGGSIGVSGSDQELAKMIVANKNITFADKYQSQITSYASGNTSCYINPNILKLIASLGQTHSLYISSLNRRCTNTLTASGTRSLHFAGQGGSAVDFAIIDGKAATGGSENVVIYEEAMAILPDKKLQLGQVGCRPSGSVTIPPGNGSIQVSDTCNHVHIGVYP